MPKISALPSDSVPVSTDYVAGVQASVPGTVKFLLSSLATFFWTLANIPTGGTSPITRDNEAQQPFVASGGVWSGDAYASTLNASMTAVICYINGRRISIGAVTARAFTASKDTYIDVLDNGDGTGTLVYTTAANNAASPSLAANSMRIGIIVTGLTSIAAVGSINQGQESKGLPVASSIIYSVTDSLGNLICCRDPQARLLGYRQITSSVTSASTSQVQIVGLTCPVIVPTNRKVKITVFGDQFSSTLAANIAADIWEGVVASGSQLESAQNNYPATGNVAPLTLSTIRTPASASVTYNAGWSVTAGTGTLFAAGGAPAFIMVELN